MILGTNGIEAWVDDAGGFYLNGVKHIIRADSLGGLWSIVKRRDRYIVSGQRGVFASKGDLEFGDLRNVHSLAVLGSSLLMGSLSGGVWKKNVLDEGAEPQRTGLDLIQIWRLKAVEIE